MKRAVIALCTAVALLTQGMAWAAVVPAMMFAQKAQTAETAMPCHEGVADEAPTLSCCDDTCDCADLCAGHAAAVLPSFFFAATGAATAKPSAASGLQLSVTPHVYLKPPIAL